MVVIMGTVQEVGPGFTTDEHRLNVMLSRQKSGLLIFGDINVMAAVDDKGKGKGKECDRMGNF
jgi:superfamily I DNA and/or RNA helicase